MATCQATLGQNVQLVTRSDYTRKRKEIAVAETEKAM
jgi:hypothetical protein